MPHQSRDFSDAHLGGGGRVLIMPREGITGQALGEPLLLHGQRLERPGCDSCSVFGG
jgi:hypothetical protein